MGVCKYFSQTKTPKFFAYQIKNKFLVNNHVPEAEIIPGKKEKHTAHEPTISEYNNLYRQTQAVERSSPITSVPCTKDYDKTMRELGDAIDCTLWVAGGVAKGCKSLIDNQKKKKKANQKSYRKKK